jgi:YHS domain-containing protein
MVRDPVCGTDVNPETTNWVANHEGLDYYFCSESCQRAFVNIPYRFIVSYMTGHVDRGRRMGGGCGMGRGNGWMGYIHIAIMVLYLLLVIFR